MDRVIQHLTSNQCIGRPAGRACTAEPNVLRNTLRYMDDESHIEITFIIQDFLYKLPLPISYVNLFIKTMFNLI
jgi:hypothetical protein